MQLRLCTAFFMMLFLPSLFAQSTCPDPRTIKRTPGEYAWSSSDGRWEGYFASPRTGRGSSNLVLAFQEARWIQLTDLIDSPGITECDYRGNSMGEVIRFVSSTAEANQRPKDINWTCEQNPEIPGVQCVCSGDPQSCRI
jgi:hypothetical protein